MVVNRYERIGSFHSFYSPAKQPGFVFSKNFHTFEVFNTVLFHIQSHIRDHAACRRGFFMSNLYDCLHWILVLYKKQ